MSNPGKHSHIWEYIDSSGYNMKMKSQIWEHRNSVSFGLVDNQHGQNFNTSIDKDSMFELGLVIQIKAHKEKRHVSHVSTF